MADKHAGVRSIRKLYHGGGGGGGGGDHFGIL